MRYGEVGSESREIEMVSGGDLRMTTISELTKETEYTVEVAAETSAGTGEYSDPLTIQTPDSEWFSHYEQFSMYFPSLRCLPQSEW